MSLIYDALKEHGGTAATRPVRTRASWWAEQPARTRAPMLLAGILVLVLPLAYVSVAALKHRDQRAGQPVVDRRPAPAGMEVTPAPPPAATPAAGPVAGEAAVPLPPAPVTLPAAAPAASPLPMPAPAAAPVMAAAPAEPAVPAPAAPPPPAPAIAAPSGMADAGGPAPATAPQPISIKVERRTGAGTAARPEADDAQVARTVESIESAMAGGDLPAARQALAQLDAQLPAESLTLLRMQAWVAHAGNDAANAEKLYRRIAERVPDDINAGVNIALLDARRGDLDDARQRLTRLSGRYPRSPQIARALAELDGAPP